MSKLQRCFRLLVEIEDNTIERWDLGKALIVRSEERWDYIWPDVAIVFVSAGV